MCRGIRPAYSGRPCQEEISATGWGVTALDTLSAARNRGLMVRETRCRTAVSKRMMQLHLPFSVRTAERRRPTMRFVRIKSVRASANRVYACCDWLRGGVITQRPARP
jgi:hypothetical protein